jgi:hypothetical protein
VRPDRADPNVERKRNLLVAELRPREQEERLALTVIQARQRRRELRPDRCRIDSAVDIRDVVADRINAGSGIRPAALAAPVPANEVRRDPKQPWSRLLRAGRSVH